MYKDIIKNDNLYLLDIFDNDDIEDDILINNLIDVNLDINVNMIENMKNYINDVEKDNLTNIIYNKEELNKEWINKFYPINEEELNILRNKK